MSTGVLLFDLDGTLVDADALHFQAWRDILAPLGTDLTPDRYREGIMGRANDVIAAAFMPGLEPSAALALVDEKESTFRRLAATLEPAHGLLGFLDWVKARGTPVGVVTNAPRANAEHQLGAIGLGTHFGTVVIGGELAEAKPHPLPYLTGLDLLGGEAARSVAFEDSLSGLASAKAAGLAAVGMTTGWPAERLLAEGADLAVADFSDPRLVPFVAGRLGR